jgi:hypothetical protein
VERLSPLGPVAGEPHPEETIESPELRSLRSAAEQGELLPERQVLEREVSATSERRAQGQKSEGEGHCSPWLARRWPIVQSQDRVLANDKRLRSGPRLGAWWADGDFSRRLVGEIRVVVERVRRMTAVPVGTKTVGKVEL